MSPRVQPSAPPLYDERRENDAGEESRQGEQGKGVSIGETQKQPRGATHHHQPGAGDKDAEKKHPDAAPQIDQAELPVPERSGERAGDQANCRESRERQIRYSPARIKRRQKGQRRCQGVAGMTDCADAICVAPRHEQNLHRHRQNAHGGAKENGG